MARVLVEQQFAQPLTDEQYGTFARRLDPCIEVRHGMWRRSSISADKQRMICEFEAPDAEAVREAFRASGVDYERAWAADVFAVEDYPDQLKKLETLVGKRKPAASAPVDALSNDEAAATWNGVLFDKFLRFKHVLTAGFASHGAAALERHPPHAGARVLDVGCGFGDDTIALARATGESGAAYGVDVAPRFVEAARTDAARAGVGNATFFAADVQTDLLGGPYDLAFSRFGTMFFADPVAALRNVRRSLAPGGRLCAIVWRRREDNPWLHVAERVVRALVPETRDTGAPTCGPGPFSMSSADVTSDILLRAGFRDLAFERHDAPVVVGRDVDEAIDFAMALGPAGEILRLAGEDGDGRRSPVIAALRDAMGPYARPGGVEMESSTWIVTAR
ncbi:MAG TPA: nickel-binding protein [Polyangiaceae bacterium]|jgi:ubiquinone/menaquinone biosynthesis C-methylase UbiE|nr:nickel-binding protein [Polyangiaceae bacterium]